MYTQSGSYKVRTMSICYTKQKVELLADCLLFVCFYMIIILELAYKYTLTCQNVCTFMLFIHQQLTET